MRGFNWRLSLWLILAWGLAATASAQTPEGDFQLGVVSADTTTFPTLSLRLAARDAQGNALGDFSSLQLAEDGRPVRDFDLQTAPTGVRVLFVIDANRTLNAVDREGDIPRLAKVRAAIAAFANQYMSRAGLDHVALLVPEGDDVRLLAPDVTSPADVTTAIGAYTPDSLPEAAPIQAALAQALTLARDDAGAYAYQAIVLFSDATNLAQQLDYPALLALAQGSPVVVFAAILGQFASADEIANVTALTGPTGGYYLHMPTVESSEPFWRTIKSNAEQHDLRFRSQIATSGVHTLTLTLGNAGLNYPLELIVTPPQVTLAIPDTLLQRQGQAGAAPESFLPGTVPLTAQISWPDQHPRALTAASLIVNDLVQDLQRAPFLDPTGRLTFEWDVSRLKEGVYRLAVEVRDELGLISRSAEVEQTIELIVPVLATPTPTPAPTPTPSPLATVLAVAQPYITQRNLQLGLGALIILAALVAWLKWRRRRPPPAPPANLPPVTSEPAALPTAWLYITDNAPESPTSLHLTHFPIVIGSQAERADIVFSHPTVSRLHARLVYSNGAFLLYDEGSANGTLVNGERLGLAPHILQDGDAIHFGRVKVRFAGQPGPQTT